MITDADVKKLSQVFATKDDLKAMEARQDKKYAMKNDLKNAVRPVNKKLDTIINYFDRDISWHNRRLKLLEEKVGLETPEFVPLSLTNN